MKEKRDKEEGSGDIDRVEEKGRESRNEGE